MDDIVKLKYFNFWCQKVLPLVYDDSLSYYEVLCKVVDYINKMLAELELDESYIKTLQDEMVVVQNWIETFDSFTNEQIEKIIAEYLKVAVFFELTDAGYFVANVPETWNEIDFGTSDYDVNVPNVDYGHLILSY